MEYIEELKTNVMNSQRETIGIEENKAEIKAEDEDVKLE